MGSLSQAVLQGLKQRLSGLKILVCGDVILDRYFFGKVERISPEAPVPVFEIEKITHSLGGAGNVAANLACLGCQVELLGVVGDDEKGKTFLELAKSLGIGTSGLIPDPQRPTTIKTRIIAQAQQLLRIDREERKPLTPEIRAKLQKIYQNLLETSDGVIISDYAKGMFLSEGFTAWLIGEARVKGKPVFVDPKSENWKKYESATTITPNLKEFRAVAKFEGLNPDDLEGASQELVKRFNLEFLVVTLGKDGVFLYQPDKGSQRFPARAREVYDVSGAGDTAIASLCAFLLSGLSLDQAVELANICAGIVVGKLGTQPVYFHELENYFKEGGEHGQNSNR
jgi:rfaE bifunctional protein kinase chain/domain